MSHCHLTLIEILVTIVAAAVVAAFASPTAKAKAALTPAVETRATNGGVTQLGQRVTVACHLLRPADAVMVRLLRRPLTGGVDSEVFAVSGPRGALRPPWNSRRDATFSAPSATVAFNMTPKDEGSYACRALTLDGYSDGARVQLLMAMAPSQPRLFVNEAVIPAYAKVTKLLEGQTIRIRCTANVGKPSGTLQLLDLAHRTHLKGHIRTWTGSAHQPGSASIQTVYSSLSLAIKLGLQHQGTVFGCLLKPHPMFARMNLTLSVKSHPISVLFPVRNMEIRPYRDNYFHGDKIECRAAGRPKVALRWLRIQGVDQLRANGSTLYLQSGARVGYYAYTCEGANSVAGRNYKLRQSIGFHLRNRTLAQPPSKAPGPAGPSVPHKVKHWVRKHHRGISVFLITFGVICGFALVAVVFAYLYSTAYGGVGGSSAAYGRLRGSPEDRLRSYGEGGCGVGGGVGGGYLGGVCGDSSDEEDSTRPLNKANNSAGRDSGANNWNGTPIVTSR